MTFRQEIDSFSIGSSRDHVYPRPDFINLNRYLNDKAIHWSVADSPNITSVTPEENVRDNFALIHNIATGVGTSFAASSKGLADFVAHNTSPKSSLLFLRGFASPKWLTTIGEVHKASPELYRRHLEFQAFTSGTRDLYSSPSLPSSSARVFQLTIPTICTRNVGVSGYEPEDLQQARRLESDAMTKYFKQLRIKSKVADSVVRKCLLLSKREYVLEQTVSIEVGPPGDNWRAIIWLDSGRDLSQSVQGPWNPRSGTRAWETYFFPVIVHQAVDLPPWPRNDTTLLQNPIGYPISNRTSRTNAKPEEEWRAAQNLCLLPFQYGSSLDKDLASRDALYALSELFHFAASAQVQFLNLLHKCIERELSFVGAEDVGQYYSVSLLNLKYIKTLLTSHVQGLTETIGVLRNRQSLDWPRVDNEATAERTAVLLLSDFDHLLQRAETLARECEQGMATLANSSVLEESRRSANMAMRVQRLTIFGTIFIPLSFLCSIWGTNFKELGSGSKPLWMLFASSAPVIIFSVLVYYWEAVTRHCLTLKSKKELKRQTDSAPSRSKNDVT